MRKYSWPNLLRHAKQFKITAFYTVPSIYLRISKAPEVTDQFSWLAGAVTGAAPMDGKLQQSANKKLGAAAAAAGSPQPRPQMLGQTWGLSETTGAVTAVPAGESDDTGSIGAILPTVQLRLVDEDFRDVEPGREGELVIRGPVVTRGYYGNPAATRDAFRDGGRLPRRVVLLGRRGRDAERQVLRRGQEEGPLQPLNAPLRSCIKTPCPERGIS